MAAICAGAGFQRKLTAYDPAGIVITGSESVSGILIVLRQPLAHLVGGDAYDRIFVRIVIGGAVEDFDADAAFAQLFLGVAIQHVLDGILQEPAAPAASPKGLAQQNPAQFSAYRPPAYPQRWAPKR